MESQSLCRGPIVDDFRRWLRTVTLHKSTSGAPKSSCSRPTAWARTRSCAGRPSQRPVSGDGMEEGFDGLLRDKTRPSRIEPLKADVAERVVAMTLTDPPGEGKRSHEALKSVANAMRLYALKRPALIASIHRGNVVGLSRETSRSRSAVKTECAEQSGRRLPIRCADWFPYALVVDPVVDPELRLNARGGNSRHHVGLVDSRRNTSRRL